MTALKPVPRGVRVGKNDRTQFVRAHYRFVQRCEVPTVNGLTRNASPNTPRFFEPAHERNAAHVTSTAAHVLRVRARREASEVLSPVVERIAIDVIDVLFLSSTHDHNSHRRSFRALRPHATIETIEAPAKRLDAINICKIDARPRYFIAAAIDEDHPRALSIASLDHAVRFSVAPKRAKCALSAQLPYVRRAEVMRRNRVLTTSKSAISHVHARNGQRNCCQVGAHA